MVAHRKPSDQRATRTQNTDLQLVGGVDAPSPRRGWSAATKRAWSEHWQADIAQAVTDADIPALTRLFDAYDERDRIWQIVHKTPFADGSQGQVVQHPGWAILRDLNAQIQSLEDRFGRTPKARAQLGLVVGQAAMTAAELNALTAGPADDGLDELIGEVLADPVD